jgi:uncharacterized protein with LGFP repeats
MPNVIGAIRDKWLALGGPSSFLGQPLTDELGTPDGVGRFNHFQGGSIYWTPTIGAHRRQAAHGAARCCVALAGAGQAPQDGVG